MTFYLLPYLLHRFREEGVVGKLFMGISILLLVLFDVELVAMFYVVVFQ
ncbi:hypothetical protein [Duganella sp.]